MSAATDLYECDFYAWTQDQAALLRAWPEALRPNALDIAHLAEEIADLGGSERRAAQSLFRQVMAHLLKLQFHPEDTARPHWRGEVGEFRAQLEDVFAASPSLRARRAELAEKEWARAARIACRLLADEGHAMAAEAGRAFTAAPGYFELDAELLDPDWFPGTAHP
ncbi:DUF29 domain-containing protein [Siccirubricoccus phaeus]|uniref:DUF29 domain-containing protein n=1 Tax=Siccirubricoccus phaeus TaxID=2595053 RepID=UPI0011F2E081|nr:DUF29 domain-containing protein [Siccirubricoccus phaeus]